MARLNIARRSGLVLRGGRNVRQNIWFQTTTSVVTIAAGSTATLGFQLSAAALALRPFTVVRHRLSWHCRADVVTGGENWGGAVGGCVVSDQATAIGVTAIPTPITDQASDLWYLYAEQYGRFGGTQVEEVGRFQVIDSKAMRKVEDGEDLLLVFETPSFVNSMVSAIGGRALIKLH